MSEQVIRKARVRSWEEIKKTLDENRMCISRTGCRDSFDIGMKKHCGTVGTFYLGSMGAYYADEFSWNWLEEWLDLIA